MDLSVGFQSAVYGAVLGSGPGAVVAIAIILRFRSTGFVNLSLGALPPSAPTWCGTCGPRIRALAVAMVAALSSPPCSGWGPNGLLLAPHAPVVPKTGQLGVPPHAPVRRHQTGGSEDRFLPPLLSGRISGPAGRR